MKIKRFLIAFAALALIGSEVSAQEPKSITVPMKSLNGSGEDGTATLTQTAEGVHVVVQLSHPSDDAQPTHIHIGSCNAINRSPEYGLELTVGGHSDSVVKGVQLSDLQKAKYAINVHKSASDIGTYVSCGDIK
jgi:Cu/Zn superoxide dismutase